MSIGSLFIISGPSGSGKGTVVKALAESSNDYALSVSVTTRVMRAGEQEGVDYFFKTAKEFEHLRDTDQLLEHVTFVGNLYGTPRSYVNEKIREGKVVLLEIEPFGAIQVKEKFPESVLIFLMPPNVTELKQRLLTRGTETEATRSARLFRAREELAHVDRYDYVVINDEVGKAVESITKIAFVERLRPSRQKPITDVFFNE